MAKKKAAKTVQVVDLININTGRAVALGRIEKTDGDDVVVDFFSRGVWRLPHELLTYPDKPSVSVQFLVRERLSPKTPPQKRLEQSKSRAKRLAKKSKAGG